MGLLKKVGRRVKKRVKKRVNKVGGRLGGRLGRRLRKRGLAGLAGKKLGKRVKRIKKRSGGPLGRALGRAIRKRGGIGALASKRGRRGGFLKKLKTQLKKRRVNTQSPAAQATKLAAQSQFSGAPQGLGGTAQFRNQPAVTPSQAQSAALAAQAQFMAPQMAASQMQQGGFQGDPYDDPIKFSENMTPQERLRLGNKMRAHAERLGHSTPASGGEIAGMLEKPPMDITVAEPAAQQSPAGLQDFMAQNIDPRQQDQFAALPANEQMKYMRAMGDFSVTRPKVRAVMGGAGPRNYRNMAGGMMGGGFRRPPQMAQPFQMEPQQFPAVMGGAGPRTYRNMASMMGGGFNRPQQRPMPRGLRRAPRRGMMGMFGRGRFGGG